MFAALDLEAAHDPAADRRLLKRTWMMVVHDVTDPRLEGDRQAIDLIVVETKNEIRTGDTDILSLPRARVGTRTAGEEIEMKTRSQALSAAAFLRERRYR